MIFPLSSLWILLAAAVRSLRSDKRYTLAAAASLAIGIGLAVGLASVANTILLQPLPVPRPQEMVRVYTASKTHSLGYVSYPDYQDFARFSRNTAGVVAQTQILSAVGASPADTPRVRMGLAVSANYFDVLEVQAWRGRLITYVEAKSKIVVLSHAFWQAQFGANLSVLNRTIQLKGTPYLVIGIAPPHFGLDRFLHEDFYVPIEAYTDDLRTLPSPLAGRGNRFLAVYARAPRHAEAAAEIGALASRLAEEYPETNRGHRGIAVSEFHARLQEGKSMLMIAVTLLGLATLAFTAACVTVCGMTRLRRQRRASETALRVALGAGTARLWAEATAESLILALVGCAAGFPLAAGVAQMLTRVVTMPTDLNMGLDVRLDLHIVAWGIGIVLPGALLVGSLGGISGPAAASLLATSRITPSFRNHLLMAAIPISLATSLLLAGAFFLRDIALGRRVDLGYRVDHVLLMTFDPAQIRQDESNARAFYKELLARITHLPGVKNAALAQSIPLGLTAAQKQVKINGDLTSHGIWMNTVTSRYFELMHIPIVAGRAFDDHDTAASTPVAIVNQEMAKLWPHGAIGQKIQVEGREFTVVGVARTVKYSELNEPSLSFFYLPFPENYVSRMTLNVETMGPPALLAPAALSAARAIDSAQPVSDVRELEAYLTDSALFAQRTGALLALTAGMPVLSLALGGLLATLSAAMRARKREIGIRMALGADRASIMGLVFLESLRILLPGIGSAAVFAWICAPFSPQIFLKEYTGQGVGQSFPIMGLVFALVMGSSLTACLLPAWNASRINPAIALQEKR